MNRNIKNRWVKALRSGQYKQGRFRMRKPRVTGDLFCPLGVLCNLHAKSHPAVARNEPNPRSYLDEGQYLPAEVKMWAGLDSFNGRFWDVTGGCQTLTDLNDQGLDFETMADLIEAHF